MRDKIKYIFLANTYKQLIIIILLGIMALYGSPVDERTKYFPRQEVAPDFIPAKENFWIFIMAGQSNMAGRGLVGPQDTIPNKQILTINSSNEWILAKEPLHFYQPKLTGLDCGLGFGRELLNKLNDSIYIGLIPCAIGGSSVSQWLNDSVHNNIKLYSNFIKKSEFAQKYGTIKAIIWHQGESDATQEDIINYKTELVKLIQNFRSSVGNDSLPFIMGELGLYAKDGEYAACRDTINTILKEIANNDPYSQLVHTGDLEYKENDPGHFNAEALRILGERYADKYLMLLKK